jgi:predicted PurR-regulated permease PerM
MMRAPLEESPGLNRHVRTLVLIAATALGIYLCYRLALPFLPALAWALALAVLFAPFQRWFETKLAWTSVAAFVSVLAIGLLVVVPATFVGQRLVVQAAAGAKRVEQKVTSGEWREFLADHPRVSSFVDTVDRQIDLPGTIKTFTIWLTSFAGSIVKGSADQVFDFGLTLYLLFFFLRDRRSAIRSLRALVPITTAEMDRLVRRVGDTIFATVYGTLTVAGVQGLLGGLMFWWLGLGAPLLWGVVMALLSVVPVLGAFVIWIPMAGFLALEGGWGKALILVLWGLLVIGTVDNLLRPFLVGNRLKLHTVLAFMAFVGGLILFGPAGMILGPVTLTVTSVLLEIWSGRIGAGKQAEPE